MSEQSGQPELASDAQPKMGRPSEYTPDFLPKVIEYCEAGATDEEVADLIGISTRTLYRWKHQFPEFRQALNAGKDVADERVVRSLYQMATGFRFTETQAVKVKTGQYTEDVKIVEVEKMAPPEAPAAIFWLKNRRKADWRDKHDHELSGPGGGAIVTEVRRTIVKPGA